MLLAVAVLAATVCGVVAPPPPQPATGVTKDVPTFTIDLDAPAQQRWVAAVTQLKWAYPKVLDYILTKVPKAVMPALEAVMADFDKYAPAPYGDEMRGVAAASGYPLGDIVLMNLFYELESGCTSIVAGNANGTIYHGRNLDFDIPGLQNITAMVNFVKDGQVAYRGTTFVGYVGLLTGVRPGAFSVSVDERWTKTGNIWTNAFEAMFLGGQSIGFFLRSTLAEETSFANALSVVQTTPLISVSYIILGGITHGEGAVVTRNREAAIDTHMLAPPDRWYLVETNYEWWRPTEPQDNRRLPAEKHMNQSSYEAITGDFIFTHVTSQFNNLNSETVYTTKMSASLDVHFSVTRNNPNVTD